MSTIKSAINRDGQAALPGADDYHCECGLWNGERCQWSGPLTETVVLEWMPWVLRDPHRKAATAGRFGRYPENGAVRVLVERSCAARLLADPAEQDWVRRVI